MTMESKAAEKLLACDVGTRAFEAGNGRHPSAYWRRVPEHRSQLHSPASSPGHDCRVQNVPQTREQLSGIAETVDVGRASSELEIAITDRLIVDLEAQGGSGPYD